MPENFPESANLRLIEIMVMDPENMPGLNKSMDRILPGLTALKMSHEVADDAVIVGMDLNGQEDQQSGKSEEPKVSEVKQAHAGD